MQQDVYPLKVIFGLTSSSASMLWASYILATLATLLMLLSNLNILLLGVISCAALQHYLFIRIQFDRQLLKQLIEESDELDGQTMYLDQTLVSLGLIKTAKANRPWSQRLAGILRLFKLQVGVLMIAFILLMTTLLIGGR